MVFNEGHMICKIHRIRQAFRFSILLYVNFESENSAFYEYLSKCKMFGESKFQSQNMGTHMRRPIINETKHWVERQ